jgi:hypothetical protein
MKTPKQHQKVEVLVGGNWLPAHFVEADSVAPDPDGDGDEIWWMDYFVLENGDTIPEDTTSGDELPQWRPRAG